MEMPGAVLIGDAAGTLDAARIKGIHQAMRSGMLCAEHLTAHKTIEGVRCGVACLARRKVAPRGAQHQAGI